MSKYYYCRLCCKLILEDEKLSCQVLDKRDGTIFLFCKGCQEEGEKFSKGIITQEEFKKLVKERQREALLERGKMIIEAKMQGKEVEIIEDREKWKEEREKFIDENYRKWSYQYLTENGFKWVQETVDYSLTCRICQTDIKKTSHYLARKRGIEETHEKFNTGKFKLIADYCYPCLEKVIYSAFARMVKEELVFMESYEEFKEIVDEEKVKFESKQYEQ